MSFLSAIPLERLLWLVPVLLAIHNMEEAPFMEGWSKRLPVKIPLAITTRQFTAAVTFVTIAGFVATYFAVNYIEDPSGYLIVLGIQAILLFNAFIPHIAATIWFRMYSPGVITAVLLILPFSFYLFQRALSEQVLSWTQLWMLLGVAPFTTVFFVLITLQLGKSFTKKAA